jgi:Ca2+-binding RTX toxin-like protein
MTTFIEQNNQFNPFNGLNVGANSSSPTFADIDGDGDLDAIVSSFYNTFKRSPYSGYYGGGYYSYVSGHKSQIKYFRNTGTETEPKFKEILADKNPLNGIDLDGKNQVTLADIDGDGDFDAVVSNSETTYYYKYGSIYSSSTSQIKYFRNTGTQSQPRFREITGENNPFNDVEPGINPHLSLVDIDGDGDEDAFVGNGTNDISFFRNDGTETNPQFTQINGEENPFDGVDLIFGNNKLSFTDIDKDGDFDAIIGNSSGIMSFFLNQGDEFNPSFIQVTGETNPFNNIYVGNNVSPVFVDIDNDGDDDGFLGAFNFLRFVENLDIDVNEAPLTGDDLANTRANAPVSLNISALLANDLDPEQEIISLDSFDTTSNQGGKIIQIDDALVYIPPLNFVGLDSFTYTVVDEFGNHSSATVELSVVKSIPFTENNTSNPLGNVDVGYNATPIFVDIDGDGDLDSFIRHGYGGIKYFRNDGDETNPSFTEVTGEDNPLDSVAISDDFFFYEYQAGFALADIDGDGDFDAFVTNTRRYYSDDYGYGGYGYYYRDTITFLRNDGTASEPEFTESFTDNPFNSVHFTDGNQPSFVDLDGDGDLDAFLQGRNSLRFFNNDGNESSPIFTEIKGEEHPFAGLSVNAPLTFVDFDGDGDLDAFSGSYSGQIKFFLNEGNSSEPNFKEIIGQGNPLNGVDVGGNSNPTFADLDGDGDKDALMGNSEGQIKFLENKSEVVAIQGNNGDDNLKGNNQDNLIQGFGGNDTLKGLNGDDLLEGSLGNDLLDGGKGVDYLEGSFGNDVYIVDNEGDLVIELSNQGIDTVKSNISYILPDNVENLVLTNEDNLKGIGNELDNKIKGNKGNNRLFGKFGDDILTGGGGRDFLASGQGNDTLTGGGDNDVFVLNRGKFNHDLITDWAEGDRFKLPETLIVDDLTISSDPVNTNNTLITVTANNDLLVILQGVDLSTVSINATDFI